MPLPKPQPGLAICYDYLWRHEHEAGRDHGSKVRPCAIIVAVENSIGATEVVVAPITHLQPMPPSQGIEIPPKVKRHLGLDHDRSWVIVNDLNVFTWPGSTCIRFRMRALEFTTTDFCRRNCTARSWSGSLRSAKRRERPIEIKRRELRYA